jgi:ferredoxin
MNNEELTIEPGEVLLDAARRDAAHIGFVCDGNGLCQMCECRVIKGAEHLSPPNDTEHIWLTEEQLAEGRRLSCQASVRGPGPIEVVTRAEELRGQVDAVFNPPEGTNVLQNIGRVLDSIININVEHIRKFPQNTLYATIKTFSVQADFNTEVRMLGDSFNITRRLLTGNAPQMKLLEQQPVAGALPAPAPRVLPDSGGHHTEEVVAKPVEPAKPTKPTEPAKPVEAKTPAPAPAKPAEPAKPEPAKSVEAKTPAPAPAKPTEPAKPEPAKPAEPAKPEPAKPADSGKPTSSSQSKPSSTQSSTSSSSKKPSTTSRKKGRKSSTRGGGSK